MRIFEKTHLTTLKKYAIPGLIAILLFAFFFEWFRPLKVPGTVYLEIKRGDNLSTVIRSLYQRGITPSPTSFKLFYKIFKWKINAGDYTLKGYVSIVELARMFKTGYKKGIKVTIPEGFQFAQIAGLLEEKGILDDRDDMLSLYRHPALLEELKIPGGSLEGYCYPDTYYFVHGEKARDIILFLNRQLQKKMKDAQLDTILKDSPWTLHEMLTLASIVEGEARLAEERPLIAQVFIKRMEIGMPLESCATVLFALGTHRKKLYFEDLEIKSPYNTYKNFGLPPTPINNPGLDSIRAVLQPASTDYLYFVSKKDGSHHFSKTYQEHLQAKRMY
ncbi:MAG TPA: endolytic transglycosylase MltG [Firmicutes bacterium]|nr:endolytic transglycosylase MltG [Bacillota bacterium]